MIDYLNEFTPDYLNEFTPDWPHFRPAEAHVGRREGGDTEGRVMRHKGWGVMTLRVL